MAFDILSIAGKKMEQTLESGSVNGQATKQWMAAESAANWLPVVKEYTSMQDKLADKITDLINSGLDQGDQRVKSLQEEHDRIRDIKLKAMAQSTGS